MLVKIINGWGWYSHQVGSIFNVHGKQLGIDGEGYTLYSDEKGPARLNIRVKDCEIVDENNVPVERNLGGSANINGKYMELKKSFDWEKCQYITSTMILPKKEVNGEEYYELEPGMLITAEALEKSFRMFAKYHSR